MAGARSVGELCGIGTAEAMAMTHQEADPMCRTTTQDEYNVEQQDEWERKDAHI